MGIGYLGNLQKDQAQAKLNGLLADRAAGKPITNAQIDNATRDLSSIERLHSRILNDDAIKAAAEVAEMQASRAQQETELQYQRVKRDQEESAARAYSARVADKLNKQIVSDKINIEAGLDDFDKYFASFFPIYFRFLLTAMPELYELEAKNDQDRMCSPFDLLCSDLDKIYYDLVYNNEFTETSALLNFVYFFSPTNITEDLGSDEPRNVVSALDTKFEQASGTDEMAKYSDEMSAYKMQSIRMGQEYLRRRDTEFLDGYDSFDFIFLNYLEGADYSNKNIVVKEYKYLLFSFAKCCAGWGHPLSESDRRYLLALKARFESKKPIGDGVVNFGFSYNTKL